MGRISKQKWHSREFSTEPYSRFAELNGQHEWQSAMPNSYVLYPVRKIVAGRVVYFNFDLAKEMGLITATHARVLNKKLERTILDTFCLRIINEYDQKQNVRYLPSILKPHPYMATRYLQLQHPDKRGTTSGDGRSIWNGQIRHNGITWDISSRGTGVTCLSPGFVEAQKPIRSGSTQYGYGCGLADIDELLGAAILSEIFYQNGVDTERVLAVIDIGGGNSIGVRAAPNLMRPAHIFMHLKQNQYESLRKSVDYFISREHANRRLPFDTKHEDRDRLTLKTLAQTFAQFAAKLDREYIFAWLDWDGDNVLANGGIIDYGSIRQFGLRHDQYRYDDVERFSTTLNEQRLKARAIIQTFAQAFDFLRYGKKRPLEQFRSHWSTRIFDREFDISVTKIFLKQVGFSDAAATFLQTRHPVLTHQLYASFRTLESAKTRYKLKKVPDGVNRPAILNMRRALIDLSKIVDDTIQRNTRWSHIAPEQLFVMTLAKSARGKDKRPTKTLLKQIRDFESLYVQTVRKITATLNPRDLKKFGQSFRENAEQSNRQDRMTGDALLYIVDEILSKFRRHKIKVADMQRTIDSLIKRQGPKQSARENPLGEDALQEVILRIIDGHKECI